METEKNSIKSLVDYVEHNHIANEDDVLEFLTQCCEILDNPKSLNSVLQEISDEFENEQIEVNKYYGIKRHNFIVERCNFLVFLLREFEPDKIIIKDIIYYHKTYLLQQAEYWENEFCLLPDSNEKIRRLDANFKLELIETNFIHFSDKIENSENTKFTLSQETKLLIYDLLIMLGNVKDYSTNAQIEKVNSIVFDSLVNIKEYLSDENDIQYINSFISIFEDDTEPKKKEGQSKSKSKTKYEFDQFFNDNIGLDKINQIQEFTKNYQGKDIAAFIHLAVHKFNIMHFKFSDRKGKSAKDFTLHFKENKNYQSVNKYLSDDFYYKGNDADLKLIKTQISEILKPVD